MSPYKILKKIIKFFTPYLLLRLYWQFSYLIDDIFFKIRSFEKTNNFGVDLKNNSQECVVLLNGPSLNKIIKKKDYDFFKNKIKICVNRMCLSEYFFEIKPEFLCFMDPAYWKKNPSITIKQRNDKTFECLKKISWKITIVMSNEAKNHNFITDLPLVNKNVDIKYINTSISNYNENKFNKKFNKLKFIEYKFNKASPVKFNVSLIAIYLSINIGFSKVYLFGLDHSWHKKISVNNDNIIFVEYDNFYKKKPELIPYYKDHTHTSTFRFSELFKMFSNIHYIHEELNEYAKFMNVEIYNCTGSESNVDAYKRFTF